MVNLYVNGELKETVDMGSPMTDKQNNMFIGGDSRDTTDQLFKGKIYTVNLFSDIRTEEELKEDALWVASDTDGLMYSKSFGEYAK